MYQLSQDFLTRSRAAFLSNAPMSLSILRDYVAKTAPSTARRDTLSALDSLPRLFGRDLTVIRADVRTVRDLFQTKSAAELGISEKRFANIRSSVVGALRTHGEAPKAVTKRIPLTPNWQALLESNPNKKYRMALYRLASFCSYVEIDPQEVGRQTLLGFFHALEAEEVVKNPRRILKHTIAHWNMCERRIEGWPQIRLSSPFDHDNVALPLADFPESFREDLERWAQRLLDADPLDPDAPARPLRPVTVKGNTGLVVRFASALVHQGAMSLEKIKSLDVLVDPKHFKSGLRYFLGRLDNKPTAYIGKISKTLLYIAKHYVRANPNDLNELSRLCKRLSVDRIRQMTPRNRERLRQFDDPKNIAKLLAFPEQERSRGLKQENPYRAAKCFERALSVAILIHCGLRIQNLRTISLETDISWAENTCYLSIDGSKVKNGQNLEYEFPNDVADLLEEFVRDYRPLLAGSDGPYLFPGRDGGPRPHGTMRTDIREALRKRAGLIVNPHLMRHIIAKIVVERDPGLCIAVSRHLGHKRIDMTMAHYLGTETRASGRHINKILRDAVDERKKVGR